MLTVPEETPVTSPVDAFAVAMVVELLDHVPGEGVHDKTMDCPAHTKLSPLGVVGVSLTVTVLVEKQLPPVPYEIIAVPTATPVTVPDPTVAIEVLLEVQVPPGVAHVKTIVLPVHAFTDPTIAAGAEETVTTTFLEQPNFV